MESFPLEQKIEKCGIVGIISKNNKNVADSILKSMLALQHRGQDAAGISIFNKKLFTKKGMGLVSEVFKAPIKLAGNVGIGHTRYPTAGRLVMGDVQPVIYGKVAVAHNGNIANYDEIKNQLKKQGIKLKTTVDSELIAILLDLGLKDGIDNAVRRVMETLDGAYSVVALVDGKLIAFRDKNAIRPLAYGENDEAVIFASETSAFDINSIDYSGEVAGGEFASINPNTFAVEKTQILPPQVRHCMFEYVYFSRPDSRINGKFVFEVRKKLGEQLASEHPVNADIVVPVPDTSRTAAESFSRCLKIPIEEGLIKNRYIARTFIMPNQNQRSDAVKVKLNAVRGILKNKRVVLIDDSIIRGTTLTEIVKLVRAAGAKEVHLRITCPPVIAPCFYGVDMSTYKELIAANKSVEEIRVALGADSLGYLSIDGLKKAINLPICTGCIDEDYPTPTAKKLANERRGAPNGRC